MPHFVQNMKNVILNFLLEMLLLCLPWSLLSSHIMTIPTPPPHIVDIFAVLLDAAKLALGCLHEANEDKTGVLHKLLVLGSSLMIGDVLFRTPFCLLLSSLFQCLFSRGSIGSDLSIPKLSFHIKIYPFTNVIL